VAWDKISYVRSINKTVLQPSGHLGTYTKICKLSYDEKLPKIYFETFFPKTLERVLDVNITCQNEVKGKKIQFYSLPLHNGPNVYWARKLQVNLAARKTHLTAEKNYQNCQEN